jgi:hypothetical protein
MKTICGIFGLVVQVNWLSEIYSTKNTTSVASVFLYESEREEKGY